MLKQRIQGLMANTVSLVASGSDETKLAGLMAGEVETYTLKGEGGTPMPVLPAELNRKNFVVSSDTPTGRRSCYLQIPHVKQTSTYNDIATSVIGQFDADYDSGVKASKCKMKFDK